MLDALELVYISAIFEFSEKYAGNLLNFSNRQTSISIPGGYPVKIKTGLSLNFQITSKKRYVPALKNTAVT